MVSVNKAVSHTYRFMQLDRVELLDKLRELEYFPEFTEELDHYLPKYIRDKDLEVVQVLLKAGANPNPKESLNCYLLGLLFEYQAVKTTAGEAVLELLQILLEYGANPNRIVMNNQRAYDYSVSKKHPEVEKILLKHGAIRELRKWL